MPNLPTKRQRYIVAHFNINNRDCAAEHGVGVRRGDLRGEGHEADAELGKDKVQEDQHRQAPQLHNPRSK